jgi:hypothetical protein
MAFCHLGMPGMTDLILSVEVSGTAASAINHSSILSAVRLLRSDHPEIAAKFAWPVFKEGEQPTPAQGRFVCEIDPSEHSISSWLAEVTSDETATTDTKESSETAVERIRRLCGVPPPHTPFVLFQVFHASVSGNKHVIVIRASHSLFDAISTFQMVDQLLHKLVLVLANPGTEITPSLGNEATRLSRSPPDRFKDDFDHKDVRDSDKKILQLQDEAYLLSKVRNNRLDSAGF